MKSLDLRHDGFSKPDKRFYFTSEFLLKHIRDIEEPVLDIGPENRFSINLNMFLQKVIHNTEGNLDLDKWTAPLEKYKTIFCFEVIEHLMSPRFFLERLKEYMTEDSILFLTYPRRIELMWTDIHFHEYSKTRFRHLLKESGFVIEDYEQHWWLNHKFKIGIRPILRLTPIGAIRTQVYKLRLE